MTAFPLRLNQLSRAEADLARLRYGSRPQLQFSTRPWMLLADSHCRDVLGPEWSRVSLLEHGDRLDIVVPAPLAAALLIERMPEVDAAALDPDFIAILLEWVMLEEIEIWEKTTGRRLSVSGFQAANNTPARPGHDLPLLLRRDGVLWPVTLQFPNDHGRGGARILSFLDKWPLMGRALEALVLPARVRIGSTDLPATVLISLRVGDALLLQHPVSGDATLVVSEFLTAPLDAVEGFWHLARAPRRIADHEKTELLMVDADARRNEDAAYEATLEALPIRLTFDVGTLEMELGALRKLSVGAVLELGRSLPEIVRINANGRLFGHGELVEVEGTPAVRILRLTDHA